MLDQAPVLFGFMLFCAGSDVILTLYLADFLKRKGVWRQDMELNWLPRLIINNNPSYKKAIIWAPIQILLFLSLVLLLAWFHQDPKLAVAILTGGLFMVNYIHLHNIQDILLHAKDEAHWARLRQCEEIRRGKQVDSV